MGIEAATLGKIGLGAQAVGGLLASKGAYDKSNAERHAYEYQAKVAENNAVVATWRAQDAITRGQTETARQQLKTRQIKGAQRAALAARGVDMGEGSALNILSDTDLMGAVDAATITDNAAKEAWALRAEASGANANAGLLRARASAENPLGSALGTALTAGGAVASGWYNLKSKGTFDSVGRGGSKWQWDGAMGEF